MERVRLELTGSLTTARPAIAFAIVVSRFNGDVTGGAVERGTGSACGGVRPG